MAALNFPSEPYATITIQPVSYYQRVMPTCAYLLMRFFLRVDGIVFRVYDTRLFLDFHKNYFIREWTHKELDYQSVVQVSLTNLVVLTRQQFGEEGLSKVREPQAVYEVCDVKNKISEKISLEQK